jgi:hypothetical protein
LFSRPQGAFGVRQLAAAFKRTLEKRLNWAVFKSGSKLPHSESFAPQKVCGISRRGGAPWNFDAARHRTPYNEFRDSSGTANHKIRRSI